MEELSTLPTVTFLTEPYLLVSMYLNRNLGNGFES